MLGSRVQRLVVWGSETDLLRDAADRPFVLGVCLRITAVAVRFRLERTVN